jgi:hypothetical protein
MGLLKKILFSIILFVLGMLLINGLCAVGERLAYGALWGQDRPKGLYIHRNGSRPQLKPGAHLKGWLYDVSINSMGFRSPDLLKKKPTNGKRIWCIGGSTTFDIFASDNDSTWPSQTRRILQKEFSEYHFEEINAGIPGEVIWGSRQDFERMQRDVQADYVVIYHGPNDMRQLLSQPQGQINSHNMHKHGPAGTPISQLLSRKDIATIRVLRRALQIKQPLDPNWENRRIEQPQIDMLEERVVQFIDVVRRNRAIPIIATHALRAQPTDTGPIARNRVAESAQLLKMYPEGVIDAFEQYNLMLKQVADTYQVPMADVRNSVGPEEENWGDATHFSPPGSLLAAQEIAKSISTTLK